MKFNIIYSLIITAYSVPGLLFFEFSPFVDYIRNPDLYGLAALAILNIAIFYILLPRFRFSFNKIETRNSKTLKTIFILLSLYIIYIEGSEIIYNINYVGDRNFLYNLYQTISLKYQLERVKTLIILYALYSIIAKNNKIVLTFIIIISSIDYMFGNRSFLFYTFLIILVALMIERNYKKIILFGFLILIPLIFRTYIFSNGNEINGIDNIFAIFGELIFTSIAPLFSMGLAQDRYADLFMQLIGIDKVFGERVRWVGETIQDSYGLSLGIACGPMCESIYYTAELSYSALIIFIVGLGYAVIFNGIRFLPKRVVGPVLLFQLFLARDFVRTGLIISFSSMILWVVISLFLALLMFKGKDEIIRTV